MATMEQAQIVELTELARERMLPLVQTEADMGIRIAVEGGGCAGLQYQMEPCKAPESDDIVQEIDGITFYIKPEGVQYIEGLTIDFSNAMVDGGFKFINPNAATTCSCGTSFGI